ncbi:MAG: PaaX family transcriptional regulator [Moraxellaceae bacterium]|nr:MAG: PaaX family transcriptional regulator [Moraxellaceae bacterium]
MSSAKLNVRHLVIDLLIASNGAALTIRQLLLAANLFEFSDNSIRVAVTRLSSDDIIESAGRGKYQLTAQWQHWASDMRKRKQEMQPIKPWTQGYLAVFTGALGRVDRTALKHRERALRQYGFRELEMGLFIRPDNLAQTFEETFSQLQSNGLEPEAVMFQISHVDTNTGRKITNLWHSETLNQTYSSISHKIQIWLAQVDQCDVEQAARESLLLGREAIPLLTHDPLLPPPFIDENTRNQFVRDVQQLDQMGQRLWQQFYGLAQV